MPFIQDILKYKSLSIVGLEKNTGKTECLNYILKRLPLNNLKILVSSAGVDGENSDIVTNTSKPEIFVRKGLFFATSEKYYKDKKVVSEIYDIDNHNTATGRVITSMALSEGKIMLSGHSGTIRLKEWMDRLTNHNGIDHFIIDGALSRLTPASPSVCESLILNTGASLSANVKTLVSRTAYAVDLISLPLSIGIDSEYFEGLGGGIFSIDSQGKGILITDSSFSLENDLKESIKNINRLYFSGALTDSVINLFKTNFKEINIEIIVKDFTKLFISKENFDFFRRRGGSISVLKKSQLIAICVNPYSPAGFHLNSNLICEEIRKVVDYPVYDIIKTNYEA